MESCYLLLLCLHLQSDKMREINRIIIFTQNGQKIWLVISFSTFNPSPSGWTILKYFLFVRTVTEYHYALPNGMEWTSAICLIPVVLQLVEEVHNLLFNLPVTWPSAIFV